MGYIIKNEHGVITVNDESQINKPKFIQFITPDYEEKFTIPDGGSVLFHYSDGKIKEEKCTYLDPTHLMVGYRAYHICELAEKLERNGTRVEPCSSEPDKIIIKENKEYQR